MSGGSFESSQRTEPVCATRFSSIKNCFKTQASGLARGRGWSRIGQCVSSMSCLSGGAPGTPPPDLTATLGYEETG